MGVLFGGRGTVEVWEVRFSFGGDDMVKVGVLEKDRLRLLRDEERCARALARWCGLVVVRDSRLSIQDVVGEF